VLLAKATGADHQHEAGISLGLDHAVTPGLKLLRARRCVWREGQQGGCKQGETLPLVAHRTLPVTGTAAMIGGFPNDINA
jgi:hypothetical protein